MLISFKSLAQFEDLWKKHEKGKISTQEWYESKIRAGYIGNDSKSWAKEMDSLSNNPKLTKSLTGRSDVIFYNPKDFQIIKPNGNRYVQAYLVNLSKSTITIERKDATVDGITSFLFLDGKWRLIKPQLEISWGEGNWKQNVKPNHYLPINIENGQTSISDIKVKKKFEIRINGQIYTSMKFRLL